MASHGRTLSRTLCFGQELNDIARYLIFGYISIKEWLKNTFRASNTLLNSAENAITRKEHFSILA
jgi:hypothetical protein